MDNLKWVSADLKWAQNSTIEEEEQQQQQQHISDIIMAVEARHLNLFPSQLITNRYIYHYPFLF